MTGIIIFEWTIHLSLINIKNMKDKQLWKQSHSVFLWQSKVSSGFKKLCSATPQKCMNIIYVKKKYLPWKIYFKIFLKIIKMCMSSRGPGQNKKPFLINPFTVTLSNNSMTSVQIFISTLRLHNFTSVRSTIKSSAAFLFPFLLYQRPFLRNE